MRRSVTWVSPLLLINQNGIFCSGWEFRDFPPISLNGETKMCTDLDVWFSVLTSKLWNTHRLWPWAPAGLPIHSQQQACYECNKALVKIMGLRDLKKVVRLFHIYFLYFLHVAFFCCSCFWAGGRSCCLYVDVICGCLFPYLCIMYIDRLSKLPHAKCR